MRHLKVYWSVFGSLPQSGPKYRRFAHIDSTRLTNHVLGRVGGELSEHGEIGRECLRSALWVVDCHWYSSARSQREAHGLKKTFEKSWGHNARDGVQKRGRANHDDYFTSFSLSRRVGLSTLSQFNQSFGVILLLLGDERQKPKQTKKPNERGKE